MKNKFKVLIKSLALVLIFSITSIGVVSAEGIDAFDKPTQQETDALKSMTLDQLKAVAKPMPEGDYQIQQGEKVENYYSPIPEDGGIYYLENNMFGIDEIDYYKFLYINPSPSEPGIVQYNIFTWSAENGILQPKYTTMLVGNEGNQELYDELTGKTNSNTDNSNTKKKYTKKRLNGLDRFSTSELIAEEYSTGTLRNVILATGSNYPDALSGSVLAKKLNAPILLVNSNDNKVTFDYISKHLDKNGTIYVLGGEGAISNSIVKNLGFKIQRLSGSSRYDTNVAINNSLSVNQGTPIVIATGEAFPDALSISSIAAIKGYPIVLTGNNTLPDQGKAYISSIRPSKIYIIGGTGAVSESIKNEVKTAAGIVDDNNIVRLSGSGRYETSLNIAKYFNLKTDTVTFATGEAFPDALSGSVLAAKYNSPIILVGNDAAKQKAYIDSTEYTKGYLLGGTGALNSNVENALFN